MNPSHYLRRIATGFDSRDVLALQVSLDQLRVLYDALPSDHRWPRDDGEMHLHSQIHDDGDLQYWDFVRHLVERKEQQIQALVLGLSPAPTPDETAVP